ncbi:hypothetical protein [Noviherbaspirillum aridicola]|uniref:Uncharacterized protein n=1 Tax=Noviherbaspirillum aridicola TaxID=2849687 RepID=A0ABQ4Q8Z1_9BURK|nr:hypothetical protein [Noviherbaspirillum aridicola]GIZ53682.1 hypothetical protein NCCP691_36960 [Noviherbaspirillum aridicola]
MANIAIHDLQASRELGDREMSTVKGGNSWLAGLGPVANVNIGIDQNIAQMQNVQVNALNNVGVIGAGFGPLRLDVSPAQWAGAAIAL